MVDREVWERGVELASDNNFGNWELQWPKWEMQSWSPLMWFALSLSLPLTLGLSHSDGPFIRCGQHFGHRETRKKNTFHMLPISFEWLFPLVKVPVLSNSHSVLTFLHFSLLYFFIFDYKNGPYSRSPGHFGCSCAQNYHNSYNHSPTPSSRVLPPTPLSSSSARFISGWTMQKIKTVIPKSHERAHCLKICYRELNPYHFVRRMNRLPSLKLL